MPTWFTRRILDLVRKLTDLYYTRKYGTMARRLGRPGLIPDERRGFVLLQIDGLSHEHLVQAISAGHMPYLSQLLVERKLTVSPWRCGLPSSTPAVQAGMMFGNRFDIPGFSWYEKDRDATMTARRPDHVQLMRSRIGRDRPGILRGGSCYVSMFDGDADLALFTLSAFHRQYFFESVRGMGLFMLFLLSPYRVLRLLGMTAGSYLTGLGRRLLTWAQPGVINPLDIFSPLLHAAADALFVEVQTFGVMLDIYRCVPAIYANYNSYDEAAHEVGPTHPTTFRILQGVDKRIHQIDRMRGRYRRRRYDLYLISDHGNSPAIPFRWRQSQSLGQYIVTQIGRELSLGEMDIFYTHSQKKAGYLLDELEMLEQRVSPRLRRILASLRRYADRQTLIPQKADYDPTRQRDVVVSPSGPLAHVYFNVSPRSLDLMEVVLLYPHLLDSLFAIPEIGAVIGRAGDQTLILGQKGGAALVGGQREVVEGSHPLAPFGDVAYAVAQIHRVAHFPHTGDLVILGAVEPDGSVITFEEQSATHGGLGGPQGLPFIAWPPECPLAPEALKDAQDIYPYFMERYHSPPIPSP